MKAELWPSVFSGTKLVFSLRTYCYEWTELFTRVLLLSVFCWQAIHCAWQVQGVQFLSDLFYQLDTCNLTSFVHVLNDVSQILQQFLLRCWIPSISMYFSSREKYHRNQPFMKVRLTWFSARTIHHVQGVPSHVWWSSYPSSRWVYHYFSYRLFWWGCTDDSGVTPFDLFPAPISNISRHVMSRRASSSVLPASHAFSRVPSHGATSPSIACFLADDGWHPQAFEYSHAS